MLILYALSPTTVFKLKLALVPQLGVLGWKKWFHWGKKSRCIRRKVSNCISIFLSDPFPITKKYLLLARWPERKSPLPFFFYPRVIHARTRELGAEEHCALRVLRVHRSPPPRNSQLVLCCAVGPSSLSSTHICAYKWIESKASNRLFLLAIHYYIFFESTKYSSRTFFTVMRDSLMWMSIVLISN